VNKSFFEDNKLW